MARPRPHTYLLRGRRGGWGWGGGRCGAYAHIAGALWTLAPQKLLFPGSRRAPRRELTFPPLIGWTL